MKLPSLIADSSDDAPDAIEDEHVLFVPPMCMPDNLTVIFFGKSSSHIQQSCSQAKCDCVAEFLIWIRQMHSFHDLA